MAGPISGAISPLSGGPAASWVSVSTPLLPPTPPGTSATSSAEWGCQPEGGQSGVREGGASSLRPLTLGRAAAVPDCACGGGARQPSHRCARWGPRL